MNIVNSHRFTEFNGLVDLQSGFYNGFGNRSRSFDGVDDTVNLGQTTDNAIFTASVWVKLKTHNGSLGEGLFGKWQTAANASWLIYTRPTLAGNFTFIVRNGLDNTNYICDSGIAITIGQWTHIAGVADGTNLTLYVNGVSAASIAYDGTIHSNSNADTNIGSYNDTINSKHMTDGNIADCRLYNTDLTATEISDLYSGTNITTNLVGHWLTDADNVLDAAGTNHGTNYGSKYSYDNPSPPVEFGSASRSFDGVNDYVAIPSDAANNPNSTDSFSAFCWIKSTNTSNTQFIFNKQESSTNFRGWGLITISSQSGRFWFASQTTPNTAMNIASLTSVLDGQWHHVGFTYDGSGNASGVTLYVDGLDDTGVIQSDNLGAGFDSTVDLNLGARQGSLFYDGKMADMRIYDTNLTTTQVSDLYAGTDVQTNLVGHYLTDNDDVEDKAGTNDGTNSGSTYSYDNPPMDLVPSRQASRNFNGTSDYIDWGDSDDFSFGDSVSDSPFSISAWVKPNDVTTFRIFNKWIDPTNKEWLFDFNGNDQLTFFIYDAVISSRRGHATPVLTSLEGTWIHAVATYDGRGGTNAHEGMKIYANGVSQTLVQNNAGNYTAMHNTNCSVTTHLNTSRYTDGKLADIRLYNSELTASQVLDIYNGTTDRTNLIGQWLTNSDDLLDHAGTNDGTNFGSTYSTDSPS